MIAEKEYVESSPVSGSVASEVPPFRFFPFYNRKQAGFVLFLIALVFYSPSYYNEFALDDGITIHQNSDVLKGISGIKDIITKDAYHSFYERMNATDQLQGGRYRPLPYITYAIEQEIIGPYRTGFYNFASDLNKNGTLDHDEIEYSMNDSIQANGYEYNSFIDVNNDGIVTANECENCWDLNKNFKNDAAEDLNADGCFNEYDCYTQGSRLRHFNNIILYAIAGLLVYLVFSTCFFNGQQDMAFAAALLFIIHPVHSESVANIRGRDDLLSVIFMMLTFYFSFRALRNRNTASFILAGAMLFLALMSKEYALLMYLLVPLSVYVVLKEPVEIRTWIIQLVFFVSTIIFACVMDMLGWYLHLPPALFFFLIVVLFTVSNALLFREQLLKNGTAALMMMLFVAGIVYTALRLNAVSMNPGVPDTELLNDPYLLASNTEAFATKVFALLIYLKLSFLPHPLVSDYSFATIAYRALTDGGFIASFLVHLTLLAAGIWLSYRRRIMGFAIIIYLALLLAVSNIFFPSGIMMLENFLFHASIGLCMALAYLLIKLMERLNLKITLKRNILLGILALLTMLGGIKAWERSRDWKNDVTLFLKDVQNAPNSVLVLGNAGARWIDLADTREITGVSLPGQDTTKFNDYNGQLNITEQEMKANGYEDKREAAIQKGIGYLKHAVELHPRYVNGYLNLGLAYFKLHHEKEAIFYWKNAEILYPSNPFLKMYYDVYSGILKTRGYEAFNNEDMAGALAAYKKWVTIRPNDAEAWYMAGGVCYKLNNRTAAKKYWEKALALKPDYEDVKKALAVISTP